MIWSMPIIFLVAILLLLMHDKIKYIKLRNKAKKVSAEVVEYKKERGPFRNDFTLLNYPYVKIETEKDKHIIVKLRFANNWNKPFKIGEKIPVFWNESDLFYWNAYDRGLYKYLPESWRIFHSI